MTRVYCTHRLQKFIGKVEKDLPTDLVDSKYGDWNANMFWINKRKFIILTNNLTNYTIILADFLKKDFKNFKGIFEKRVLEQLLNDNIINIDAEFVDKFVGNVTFYKTNNDRRLTGVMNDIIYNFKANCLTKYQDLSEMNIFYENGIMNTMPTMKPRIIKKKLSIPIENLNELIKTSAQQQL